MATINGNNSSCFNNYIIMDIRTSEQDITKNHMAMEPSDAFNSPDLAKTIIESLDQPFNHKSIPTVVLYNRRGLQLFDKITHLDEYYLTNAEIDILQNRADQLANRLKNGSVLIELGAGSLRKTQLILQAIEKKQLHVTYYALDLDQYELEESLASLGKFTYIKLVGLLGTYDQVIPWLSQRFTSIQKAIFWLGSSIGNLSRYESAIFLQRFKQCMKPGDLFVIGFDKRNKPSKIEAAYDDSKGITRQFIMNGLEHVNSILEQDLFNLVKFEYDSQYHIREGRHVAHYRAKENLVLNYHKSWESLLIPLKKDELIHVEQSYKYSLEEVTHILNAAKLDILEDWVDSKNSYRLTIAEWRPFFFPKDMLEIQGTLFPDATVFPCHVCNQGHYQSGISECLANGQENIPKTNGNVSKNDLKNCETYFMNGLKSKETRLNAIAKYWPEDIPTLQEWQELWKAWDMITGMIDHDTMLFEQPIALRHPFIFYLGHIPGFLDIQLTRHNVDANFTGRSELTEPSFFADIFERGIDPDMEDPSICHSHSEIPSSKDAWPSVDSILRYKQNVRNRLRNILEHWEAEEKDKEEWMAIPGRKRYGRVIWMCFEHEAMHLETLLYMLVQSPNVHIPKGLALPIWKAMIEDPTIKKNFTKNQEACPIISVPKGTIQHGHNDDEDTDFSGTDITEYGWDNEHPERLVSVAGFDIQTRPITNGEYLTYLLTTDNNTIPASWERIDSSTIGVKTVFGLCPISYAKNWPVQVSYNEAKKYANHFGMRLPTELEMLRFRETAKNRKIPNIGFRSWHPTDVGIDEIATLGDVWEWTETIWENYEGFKSSELYPGYSADFFDNKHRVVVGGSWATHPRIAERRSFRNWYQSGYPYVFCGFRCCSLTK